MFKSKKAQGMTLNVVVVAAIVLLVLVVLVLIFTGKIGNFVGESEKCITKGGTCVAAKDGCNRANLEAPLNAKCYKADGTTADTDQVCCIKVGVGA
ncbi:hypothetical protein HYU06_05995 [Candidatus Woesearchaeota archaeon]|nr:hypothetical protein [Candidatus Woesearchaeota archaeon]